jgi:very-short-patch-repair endonuclease
MQPITLRARNFRKKQTEAETILWQKVRDRQLGYKIVRQKPILIDYFGRNRAFVADFFCYEGKLVIEVDGSVHTKQVDYDSKRTLLLNQKGIKLVRFTNAEIMNDVGGVLDKIKKELCRLAPDASPHP